MVLVAEAQQLKAKLMLQGKFRPEKMVRKKMPAPVSLPLPHRREQRAQRSGAALLAQVRRSVDVHLKKGDVTCFCELLDKGLVPPGHYGK